jgi:hypothetical protein
MTKKILRIKESIEFCYYNDSIFFALTKGIYDRPGGWDKRLVAEVFHLAKRARRRLFYKSILSFFKTNLYKMFHVSKSGVPVTAI